MGHDTTKSTEHNDKANTTRIELGSMSAARDVSKTASPTKHRDGFSLIPATPIVYDEDLTTLFKFQDITFKVSTADQCARIAFNRPHVLHAFRPTTINEIRRALDHAQDDIRVASILLSSEIYAQERTPAFCAGGDQVVRSSDGGYIDGSEDVPRLRVLDLQVQMRRCPKPIIAVVRGYAIGGGHILHMVADITLAGTDAIFGQTGPRMGSFDAGYGSTRMARLIGQKKAREMWFTCRFYDAQEALQMGLINAVYDVDTLEGEVGRWVRRIAMNSPTAIACTKAALNADEDGAAGIQLMGGQLTRLFYMTDEAKEGRDAYLQRRAPQFRKISQSRL
jgi:naphthoate synthase